MEIPKHLHDKYNLYAIWLEEDFGRRPSDSMIIFHIARPVSFKTLIETYIYGNLELSIQATNEKIPTRLISGVQKISNSNIPLYELRQDGTFTSISR